MPVVQSKRDLTAMVVVGSVAVVCVSVGGLLYSARIAIWLAGAFLVGSLEGVLAARYSGRLSARIAGVSFLLAAFAAPFVESVGGSVYLFVFIGVALAVQGVIGSRA